MQTSSTQGNPRPSFSPLKIIALGILLGVFLGVLGTYGFTAISANVNDNTNNEETHDNDRAVAANEPLYWVAPMDPNYRRDKPGQSPMGMDLVPVYANQNSDDSPGTVTISANVENNLGVKTAMAKLMVLDSVINAVGYVRYNEDTLIHIHPRVAGWVEKLYIKATGDYVQKGTPLYSLYSPELVNAQEEYLLAIQRSNSNLIQAAKSRLSALQVSSQTIAELDKTKTVQQNLIFTAPQTGFVDNLNIRQGFYVQPSTTMMSIGGLDEVWVDVDIFARDAAQLALGQSVMMSVDYAPGETWEGSIDYIYPTLDQITRTVKARVRFDNAGYQLKPNMFANLIIQTDRDEDAIVPKRYLMVPAQAVIRTGAANKVVLALGEGKFKSIEVTLGRVSNDYIEIIAGLRAGDEVVTSAQFLLDSESSIDSDFMRMLPPPEMPLTVWTQAQVNQISISERKVNLSHGELAAWGMPAMTMNFMVANEVDMNRLSEGMDIHIEITKLPSGMYQVNTVHIVEEGKQNVEGMEHMQMDKPSATSMQHMPAMENMPEAKPLDKAEPAKHNAGRSL